MKACRVQFNRNGKRYFFLYEDHAIVEGTKVVVETARGIELGVVTNVNLDCPDELKDDIKSVMRIATKKDIEQHEKNVSQEPLVLSKCAELIIKNNLEMKLISCEYTLDHQKLLINFESDDRVDFRQLVKDLAEEFHVRIELRQIGSRDSAKILGGLGPCGLPICCATFIEEFDNISIKMAKNQNLSLNPQKINGSCGKLLCCIRYENDTYTDLRVGMPDLGDVVTLEAGDGKVVDMNILKREIRVKMFTPDESYQTVSVNLIKAIKPRKSGNQ